jgi:DNA-binding transcriptional LysR family regulator
MNKVLESHHLRLIAQVARTESVTRAADLLHVTPSAVSHQLGELEDRLGTPIFVRSGRRMLPTPAGRLLVEAAGDVLGTIARVESQVEQIARHAAGELRVCTHCYTGYSWLPAIVAGLRQRYPAFGLQIVPEYTVEPIAALLDGKLDLALMNEESDDRRLRYRELFDDEHVAVVPAAHRYAGGNRRRAALSVLALAGEQLRGPARAAAGGIGSGARHLSAAARGHHRNGEGGDGRDGAAEMVDRQQPGIRRPQGDSDHQGGRLPQVVRGHAPRCRDNALRGRVHSSADRECASLAADRAPSSGLVPWKSEK